MFLEKCHLHYKSYNFYLVVDHVIEVLHAANNFFETTKPWELRTAKKTIQLDTVLCITLETLRICGIILQPIIPTLSNQLLNKLQVDSSQRMWSDLYNVRWLRNDDDKMNVERPLGIESAVLFRRIRLDDVGGKKKEKVKN